MKRPIVNPTDDFLDAVIDQHLAESSYQLAPSSGFVLSVMDSIEAQAAEPGPIAFPWGRALPGLIAVLCSLPLLVVVLLRARIEGSAVALPAHSSTQFLTSLSHTLTASEITLSWIAVAALLSIAAVAASFRLTGRNQ